MLHPFDPKMFPLAYIYLIIMILISLITSLAADNVPHMSDFIAQRDEIILSTKHLHLNISWPAFERAIINRDQASNAIFIHATVGIFHRKRGKSGTWGHGTEILIDMLKSIDESKAIGHVRCVYIGLLGSNQDIDATQKSVNELFRGDREWEGKLEFIVMSENLDLSEFPTLMMMQLYANLIPPALALTSHLLYMHTKGVRRNGDYSYLWRVYMQHMVLTHYLDICNTVMREMGFLTCGALKTPTSKGAIYAGNFWWTTASYLQSRTVKVVNLAWSSGNRYAAENFLLSGVSAEESKYRHYCIDHTHHDMQNCPTPVELYANATPRIRLHGDCYNARLRPQKQSKRDRASWCHKTLPVIP